MQPDAESIATAITNAPAWCRIALATRSERLRQDAATELARHLHEALYAVPSADPRQIALPLLERRDG